MGNQVFLFCMRLLKHLHPGGLPLITHQLNPDQYPGTAYLIGSRVFEGSLV
jgi:hypothetical protein